jgi:hypothetical protein
MLVQKIVSGGQTGVDRAALDVAIEMAVPYGGWAPFDRRAEDGKIPDRYALEPVPLAMYPELGFDPHDPKDHYRIRTHLNVRDSDATLILVPTPTFRSAGTQLTINTCRAQSKPCLILHPTDDDAPWRLDRWVRDQKIQTMNVAGPRASRAENLHDQACEFLRVALRATR